jgi:hypothetical protein
MRLPLPVGRENIILRLHKRMARSAAFVAGPKRREGLGRGSPVELGVAPSATVGKTAIIENGLRQSHTCSEHLAAVLPVQPHRRACTLRTLIVAAVLTATAAYASPRARFSLPSVSSI